MNLLFCPVHCMVVEKNPELIVCIINKNEYCIIKDKYPKPKARGGWVKKRDFFNSTYPFLTKKCF